MIHVSSNSNEKQRYYGCSKLFLSTTLQIWCYCGHVIKSRTMRHLNFDCQLNLSKSYEGLVIISSVVSAQCRKVWLGGEKRPPAPREISHCASNQGSRSKT